jgi:hypothetical protein
LNRGLGHFFEKAYGICPSRTQHHEYIMFRVMLEGKLGTDCFGRFVN